MKRQFAIIFSALLGVVCTAAVSVSAMDGYDDARADKQLIKNYPPSTGHGHNKTTACLSKRDETALHGVEDQLLGSAHAREHAQARAETCQALTQAHEATFEARLQRLSLPFDVAPLGRLLDHISSRAKNGLAPLAEKIIGNAYAATGSPAQVGQWSTPTPLPLVGIHAVLLPTGKVLFFTYKSYSTNTGAVAYLWDPLTNTGHNVNPPANVWCAAQTPLANGLVLTTGGTLAYASTSLFYKGLNQIYTFNPFNETWTRQPDMRHGRWYPSVTKLGDGRALIMGGLNESGTRAKNTDVEVFVPAASLDGIGSVSVIGTRTISGNGYFPHQFVMPSGQVLLAGPGPSDTALLNPLNWAWSDIPNLLQARYWYGNGVLLPGAPSGSNKVMLIGGVTAANVTLGTTEIFDAANPAAGWKFQSSLPQPRHNINTVILPDGKLLTVGGNSTSNQSPDSSISHYNNPQREAELYNPVTNIWTPMATQQESRAYHSTALLLPDARVLTAGDDGPLGGYTTDKVEIFSPPYLFQGARPTISAAPATLSYGQSFTIGTPDSVAKAVLIAPGSATHSNDMHQRYVPLSISPVTGGVGAVAPASGNIAPPGYYMLFLVNAQGVPSVANWVRLDPGAAPPPAATLQFSAAGYSVSEAAATATINVTRSGASGQAVTVNYATANGTAVAGSDYTTASGTLSWAAGDSAAKTFTVPIVNDTAFEPNETVKLTLSSPSGGVALGSPGSATLTILNDDTALKFSAANYSVNEAGPTATISVARVGSKTQAVTVNYATSNGTALAGSDYTAKSGTLSWAANDGAAKTFSVPIVNDTAVEPNETVKLTLSNPTGGANLTAPTTATLTIVNND